MFSPLHTLVPALPASPSPVTYWVPAGILNLPVPIPGAGNSKGELHRGLDAEKKAHGQPYFAAVTSSVMA